MVAAGWGGRWGRVALVAGLTAVLGGLLGGVAEAAPGTDAPGTPAAPPLADPAGGGSSASQCTPGSDVVVRQKPWTQDRLTPARAWDLTTGKGVIVAVIDSGVQATAPQLLGQVLPGFDVVTGSGGGDTDCAGHGTFVAGIIAARPVPGIGFTGVAPGVKILPIRQSVAAKDGTASGMARAIRLAVNAGARVINVSSSSFFDSAGLRAAVDFAERHDVLIVAAAANEAQSGNPKSYPASYPGVVAVGAIGPDGKRGDFSETGDFIDLVAPGVDVLSVAARGNGHLVGQGTSFAAPFVAGVAALIRSYYPSLPASAVKRRLELTADHPGTHLPDPQLGYGVVNPFAAVSTVIPAEGAPTAATHPERIPLPAAAPTPGSRKWTVVWLFSLGALGLAVVGPILAVVIPRGRRRSWRPAS
ncbi:MAG: rane-anchored mycosin [Mycobacteriales bacterium]